MPDTAEEREMRRQMKKIDKLLSEVEEEVVYYAMRRAETEMNERYLKRLKELENE